MFDTSSLCKDVLCQFIFSVNLLAFVVALVLKNIYKIKMHSFIFFTREKGEIRVNEESW